MAIKLGEGFEITGYDPIDVRLVLTKDQMSKIVGDEDSGSNPDDFAMPEIYFAFCSDDGQWYKFDYEADMDPETGKFRLMELGGSTPSADSGSASDMAAALTNAEPGDLFYNTDDGKVYVCVVDSEGNKSWQEKQPNPGEMMFDEATGKILYFDGTQWKEVGGLNSSSVGDTAPSNPQPGDQWLDTTQTPPVLKEYDGTSWNAVPAKEGDMMYDSTNDKILYFDGTEWKEIGGAVEKAATEGSISNPEEGKVYYMENGGGTGAGQYEVYEDGKWFKLAKIWEGTTAQYTTLGGDTWSTAHPDVICFIND